jgi:hypothetical protein
MSGICALRRPLVVFARQESPRCGNRRKRADWALTPERVRVPVDSSPARLSTIVST